jgi:hypothetical protein
MDAVQRGKLPLSMFRAISSGAHMLSPIRIPSQQVKTCLKACSVEYAPGFTADHQLDVGNWNFLIPARDERLHGSWIAQEND